MPQVWTAVCKDCGKQFTYSDAVHLIRSKRGLSAPERCQQHRQRHSLETQAMGSSHFGLQPLEHPNILGTRFLGWIDRSDRAPPVVREIEPDGSGMDLGLKGEHVAEIYKALETNKVLIIVAPTGAGKSTVIPFRLLNPLPEAGLPYDHFTQHGRPIVVTQPRRDATSDIPDVIAAKMHGTNVGPGSEIGFRHGQDRDQTDPWNRLIFVTDGTLVNWLTNQRAGAFSIVIVDEAHERSTTIDLILGLMRRELLQHPHLKLIVLSATIHSERFVQYFSEALPGQVWLRDFKETEKSFGYQVRWPTHARLEEAAAVEAVAAKVADLLHSTKEGGILAFLQGREEIHDAINLVEQSLDRAMGKRTLLVPYYASLSPADRAKATNPVAAGLRRVVFATNVAETSLTIPDVIHLVDCGLIKESVWDASTAQTRLVLRWHSQAGCKQRWGRVGRARPGVVYPLYSEEQFKEFEPFTAPAVVRSNLDEVFVRAKRAGVKDLATFPWLDRPPAEELQRVETIATARGIVDNDGDATVFGAEVLDVYQRIARFFTDDTSGISANVLDMASLLLLADRYACLVEAATLISMIPRMGEALYRSDVGALLFDSEAELSRADEMVRTQTSLRAGCDDDLDLALKIMALHETVRLGNLVIGGSSWAEKAGINAVSLDKAVQERDEILGIFVRRGQERGYRPIDFKLVGRLRLLICAAWPDKLVEMTEPGRWKARAGDEKGTISHRSLARAWLMGTSAIIGAFSWRVGPTTSGSKPEPIASFVMRGIAPPEGPLALPHLLDATRARRLAAAKDAAGATHWVDQIFPVDMPLAAAQEAVARVAPELKPNFAMDESCDKSATIVHKWGGGMDGVPYVSLANPTELLRTEGISDRDHVEVQLVRAIPFAPVEHGVLGFVGLTNGGMTVYIAAADVSLDPRSPALGGLVGQTITFACRGVRSDGTPLLTIATDLEKSWLRISRRARLHGVLTRVGMGESGERSMEIIVSDPTQPYITHVVHLEERVRREHLEALHDGDRVHFSLLSPRREPDWHAPIPANVEIEATIAENLGKLGFRLDRGSLRTKVRPSADTMYKVITICPEFERAVRTLFRVSRNLRADAHTLDTDESLRQAIPWLERALQTWTQAWSLKGDTTKSEVERLRGALEEAKLTLHGKTKAQEILSSAWRVQSLQGQLRWEEGRESKLASTSQNNANLEDRISRERDPEKRIRLTGYLVNGRAQLAKLQSEPHNPGKVRDLQRELDSLRPMGERWSKELEEWRQITKPASRPEKPSVGAGVKAQPAGLSEKYIPINTEQLARLHARKKGFFRTLFGAGPAKSISEEVVQQYSVSLEMVADGMLRIRGSAQEVVDRAAQDLWNRLA